MGGRKGGGWVSGWMSRWVGRMCGEDSYGPWTTLSPAPSPEHREGDPSRGWAGIRVAPMGTESPSFLIHQGLPSWRSRLAMASACLGLSRPPPFTASLASLRVSAEPLGSASLPSSLTRTLWSHPCHLCLLMRSLSLSLSLSHIQSISKSC